MKKIEFLTKINSYINNINQDSLKLSMNNVHSDGLFSLVIDGTEFGKLTRVFIADKKLKPFGVQLHSHRYPIRLTTIKGQINHYVAFRSEVKDLHTIELSEFTYKSPLNGGNGLSYLKETNIIVKDYLLPIGATLEMTSDDLHTVSCSKGSIWIVEELGFNKDESRVLGVPFITNNLYTDPLSFQTNDKFQLFRKEITNLINNYNTI